MNRTDTYTTIDRLPLALTIAQLAQVLHIGKSSAYALVNEGTIRSVRIGRQIRIPKEELLCYLGHTT